MEERNGDGATELGTIRGIDGDRFNEEMNFSMFEGEMSMSNSL